MVRACSRSWWCRNNERSQVGWVGESRWNKPDHRARWRDRYRTGVGKVVCSLSSSVRVHFRSDIQLEQKLYQPHGVVTYVRDEYGLRGPEKAVEKIEVASVGGSTTDQTLISEGETWQDVIFAQTGIRITNAGDEGISSTGHVVALVEWLHRIPNFRPRFYLHYIGLNDAAFAQAWTLPGSKDLVEAQIADQENRRALHRFIRGRSALVQGFIALKSWIGGPPSLYCFADSARSSGSGGSCRGRPGTDHGVREAHL